jgi:VIT1/CCC1 family predicted Fe2+/Mn2+ transporter
MASFRSAIAGKYLDPASSLSEVLFGLIMTLTFTLGAGLTLQEEGREGARDLLIATIGCNIAWGVIDGVLYIVGRLFERGRRKRLAHQVKRTRDDAEAIALVAGEYDDLLGAVTSADERRSLYQRVADRLRTGTVPPNRMTRDDLMGAIASFWLVFLASLPAAIPFFLIDDPWRALRVSNGLLLALLFLTGQAWGRHAVARPWLAGLAFLLGGTVLVVIAIALGG